MHTLAHTCTHESPILTRDDVSVCRSCGAIQYYNVDTGDLEWFLDGELLTKLEKAHKVGPVFTSEERPDCLRVWPTTWDIVAEREEA